MLIPAEINYRILSLKFPLKTIWSHKPPEIINKLMSRVGMQILRLGWMKNKTAIWYIWGTLETLPLIRSLLEKKKKGPSSLKIPPAISFDFKTFSVIVYEIQTLLGGVAWSFISWHCVTSYFPVQLGKQDSLHPGKERGWDERSLKNG